MIVNRFTQSQGPGRSYARGVAEPRVRLQDVADEAGLSKAAASYALRGLKGSAQTQERVQGIAERLGYTAHPAAQALAAGRVGAVGLCGALTDLWHQTLTVHLAGRLWGNGVACSIADTAADPGRERDVVEGMARDRLDGAIVLVSDPEAAWWADLAERFAVVAVGDVIIARPEAASVAFDNEYGIRTALRHLSDLGHRRIALLTTTLPASPGRPGARAAARFAETLGVELTVATVPPSSRGARSPVHDLLGAVSRPTALFCLSDSVALGAYRAAGDLGLRIPQDVSILGFDDHDLADLVNPALTTFSWDVEAITETTIDHLIAALDGGPGAHSTFRPTLVDRASTAPPAVQPDGPTPG